MADEASAWESVTNWVLDKGINGVAGLSPASELAAEYLQDRQYERDNELAARDSMVDSLINWEAAKHGGIGFVTGLGGLITLPVTVPADVASGAVLSSRLVAAIAIIYGHKIGEDRVRTAILLSALGGWGKDAVKDVLAQVGIRTAQNILQKGISGATLRAINQAVGMRLLTKAGSTGIINLGKAIPLIGGAISGGFNVVMARKTGKIAKDTFRQDIFSHPSPEGKVRQLVNGILGFMKSKKG